MPEFRRSIAFRLRHQRRRIAAARLFVERNALARIKRPSRRDVGRILCYHSVGQPEMGVNDVEPALFRRQLEGALSLGYRFVSPSTIALTGGSAGDLAVTFDDATSSVITTAAPILRDLEIPYAVFVVSGWADGVSPKYMTWADLAELASEDVEVGSHSVSHPQFSQLDDARARAELERSRARITEKLGVDVWSFAVPFGQSADWTSGSTQLALDVGYRWIYAQAESTRPVATIGRTFITQFDTETVFRAALGGAFDDWEEWC